MSKQSSWLRALEIISGLVALVAAVVVIIFPSWDIVTIVFLLSVGLIFLGLRSISIAGNKGLLKSRKWLSAITGVIILVLAVLVVIFPGYGVETLLLFLSFGLIIYGCSRLLLGFILKVPSWIRVMLVTVGIIDLILSTLVLLFPGLALLTFATILGLLLLISGAESVISGFNGRTWLEDTLEVIKKERQ